MPVTINASANGPFVIAADESQQVTVVSTSGEALPRESNGAPLELCRCGQSSNKPFCDGTHETVGFKDPA